MTMLPTSSRRRQQGLLGILLTIVLAAGVGLPAASQPAGSVVVYTALETDEVVRYVEQAKRDLPGLDIKVLRLSTGELNARVLAEKDNPQADPDLRKLQLQTAI